MQGEFAKTYILLGVQGCGRNCLIGAETRGIGPHLPSPCFSLHALFISEWAMTGFQGPPGTVWPIPEVDAIQTQGN